MNERHRRLLPLVFISIVALALFASALVHNEVPVFRDHSDYFMPLRYFTALHLRAWRLPLWNPYSASGEPWLANPQTAVFYPPTWIFVVFPFRTAYVLFLVLHLALLGCGAYLLFARTASRRAAIFGAIALMLCGPVLSMLDVGDNLASFAWLPWVIGAAIDTRRDGSPAGARLIRDAVLLALCFLAGEPFIAAIAAVIYVIIVRRWRPMVMTGIMTIGLCAIELLPFMELVRRSDRRGGFTGHDILRDSMPLGEWWRVAISPRPTASGFDAALSQHFVPIVYIGIFTVAFALVGLVLAGIRRQRSAFGYVALLAVSMLIAAGPSFLVQLPLTILRYPARMVPFGAFAIVALAVIGWDRVRHRRAWLDVLAVIVVIADLMPAVLPLLHTAAPVPVPYPRSFGADAKIVRIGDAEALARGEAREPWIAGYLNLLDRRFDAWTASPLMSTRYTGLYVRALRDRAAMRALSTGYVLSSQPLAGAGVVPLVRTERVFATKLADILPMARVIAADGSIEPVRGLTLDARSAHAIVDTRGGGLLVLTQCDASGWKVFVDGVRAREETADGVFRAVHIGAGHHDVRWTYSPLSFWIGAIITIVSIIAMIVLARLR